MEITIQLRELSGVAILDTSGRITLGDGSVVLRETVREQIASGKQAIIINLGDVTYMDSSGLGELISAFTTAKNHGATLKLLNLTKGIRNLMEITKLYTVFDIYDDEDAAVASFRQQKACVPLAAVGHEKDTPY
jgi:anti-sigma B factor antagonist